MATDNLFSEDDETLVRLTLEGEKRAFGEIVRRFEKPVAATVRGMLGDIQQAEDVGQETFIRLYNSLADFRGESRLGTYIQRIAINLSLNEMKKRSRFTSFFYRSDTNDEPSYADPEEPEGEALTDMREIVDHALKKLSPDFRSVVTLRLIQGYSTKETAEILNLPLGTVLSRLARAKEQLREIMEKLI